MNDMSDQDQPQKPRFSGFGETGFVPAPKPEKDAKPTAEEPQTPEPKSKK